MFLWDKIFHNLTLMNKIWPLGWYFVSPRQVTSKSKAPQTRPPHQQTTKQTCDSKLHKHNRCCPQYIYQKVSSKLFGCGYCASQRHRAAASEERDQLQRYRQRWAMTMTIDMIWRSMTTMMQRCCYICLLFTAWIRTIWQAFRLWLWLWRPHLISAFDLTAFGVYHYHYQSTPIF